jgi:hypothetical protein
LEDLAALITPHRSVGAGIASSCGNRAGGTFFDDG